MKSDEAWYSCLASTVGHETVSDAGRLTVYSQHQQHHQQQQLGIN